MARKKIGAMLEEKGYINEFQLVAALSHQRKWKSKLGQSLIELGYLEEDNLFEVLAEQLELPFINLKGMQVPPEILRRITKDFAREWLAVPVAFADGVWTVAVAEPDKDNLVPTLSLTLNGKVKIGLATPAAIELLTRKIPDKTSLGSVQPVKKAFVRDQNGAFVPAPDNGMPIVGDPTPAPREVVASINAPKPVAAPSPAPAPRGPKPEDDFLRIPEPPPDLSRASSADDLFAAPDAGAAEPDPEAPIDVGDILATEPDNLPPPPVEDILTMPTDEPPQPPAPTAAAPEMETLEVIDEPVALPDEELAMPVDELPTMPEAAPAAPPPVVMEAPSLDLPTLEAPSLDLPPLPDEPVPAAPAAPPAPPAADSFALPELPPDDVVPLPAEDDLAVPLNEAPPPVSMDIPADDGQMVLEPAYAGDTIVTGDAPASAAEPLDFGDGDEAVPLEAPNETAASLSTPNDSNMVSLDEILAASPASAEPMELSTDASTGESSAPELSIPDLPPMTESGQLDLEAPELNEPLAPPVAAEPPPVAGGDVWDQPAMDAPPPGEEEQAPAFDTPVEMPPAVEEPPAAPELSLPDLPPEPPLELLAPPPVEAPAVPDLGDAVMEVPLAPEPAPELDLSVPSLADEPPAPAPAPVAAAPAPVPPAPAEEEPLDEDSMALMDQIKALESQIQSMTGVRDSLKAMLSSRKGKPKS